MKIQRRQIQRRKVVGRERDGSPGHGDTTIHTHVAGRDLKLAAGSKPDGLSRCHDKVAIGILDGEVAKAVFVLVEERRPENDRPAQGIR